jgi:hypothetical protein
LSAQTALLLVWLLQFRLPGKQKMMRKERIDLRNLLKKRFSAKSGEAEKESEPHQDKPDAERDLSDSEQNGKEVMQESPPKHLPRPTRR